MPEEFQLRQWIITEVEYMLWIVSSAEYLKSVRGADTDSGHCPSLVHVLSLGQHNVSEDTDKT